jgi:DNA-binding transcriptional LysR family regulator
MPFPLPPFDLDLLRSFAAILDNGGFTRAAERLGRTQSTVSLQIRKLETALGQRVFERRSGSGGRIVPTPAGEALLAHARPILQLAEQARTALLAPDIEGRLRLGTPEDFATWHLPDILARFARAHPRIDLEVTCDFSVNLLDGFGRGLFDLILFKRDPQPAFGGGTGIWREPLVWVASPRFQPRDEQAAIPLVLAPAPDIYRRRALAALDGGGRNWRIVLTSPSLAGQHAAVRAGLGVSVLPRGMIPPDLIVLDRDANRLPLLADAEIVLYAAPGQRTPAAERLASHIMQSLEARRA